MTSARLRVAAVGYLNARPLFEGLDREPARRASRSTCALAGEVARRVAEDEADVALMPVAAAATIGDLRIVRGCAIGARGPVRSVVIVADRPHRGARRARARSVVADERRARAAHRAPRAARAASRARRAPAARRDRRRRRARAARSSSATRRSTIEGKLSPTCSTSARRGCEWTRSAVRLRRLVRPRRRAVARTTSVLLEREAPRASRRRDAIADEHAAAHRAAAGVAPRLPPRRDPLRPRRRRARAASSASTTRRRAPASCRASTRSASSTTTAARRRSPARRRSTRCSRAPPRASA